MSRNIVSSHELRALDIELAKFYKNIIHELYNIIKKILIITLVN